MFSILIASLVLAVRAATDCEGNCLYQHRECVKAGSYCETNSFNLWTNGGQSNLPCNQDDVENDGPCHICDNGMLTDDGTNVNRLCISSICTETKGAEGETCCSDWLTELRTPRDKNTCAESVQGVYCKPGLTCADFNQTLGSGACEKISAVGPRYLLGLGEACTFYDPEVAATSEEELQLCDRAGVVLVCDVGQYDVDRTDPTFDESTFYGRQGTCRSFDIFAGGLVQTGCTNSLHCPFGSECGGSNISARECIEMDGSFCESDADCGWGVECVWFNPHDTNLGGTCGKPPKRDVGDACTSSLDCKDGLYCDGLKCESSTRECSCGDDLSRAEFVTCGRGSTCACPRPDQIGPNVKPGCRDGNLKNGAAREQFYGRQPTNYKCYNTSQVNRFASDPARYKKAQGCLGKSVPQTLSYYREDGSAQIACPQGSGLPSTVLYGQDFKSSAFLSAAPVFALLPALLCVLSLI